MSPACRHNPQLAGRARKAVLCAALALGGGAAAMPAAVQRVELTWKLEPGTELVYRESQQFETESPQGMGTSSVRSESTRRWSVLGVDGDGNATVRLTTEQAQMNLDGLMGAPGVDSAEAFQGGSEAFLDAVADMRHTIVLDRRGVVIEMSGLEEMREALREQAQDLSSPSLAMLDGMLSAISYRVESIDGDIVVIGSSGTMSLPDGAADPLSRVGRDDDPGARGGIAFGRTMCCSWRHLVRRCPYRAALRATACKCVKMYT